MLYFQQIRGISLDVNYLLSEYVAVHNGVFKTTIRHVIPIPGIFKAIDFSFYSSQLDKILLDLNSSEETITCFLKLTVGQEKEYLEVLGKYVETLMSTVNYLKAVVESLYAKSKHLPNSEYKWANYSNDLEKYNQSVKDYVTIAEPLNKLYSQLEESV